MPAKRYYIPHPLKAQSAVEIEGDEAHHLLRVMRAQAGDRVELVNGRGQCAEAHVEKVDSKRQTATLEISAVISVETLPFGLVLAQALPRPTKLDFIIEKATELGATEIRLFPAERSEIKDLSENKIGRLQSLAIASMKQCGRLFLPRILLAEPISRWSSLPFPAFFGDLEPDAAFFSAAWQAPEVGVLFVVGPEAGFTEEELTALRRLGAQGVRLHDNILRTETAGIVALSLMSHWKPK